MYAASLPSEPVSVPPEAGAGRARPVTRGTADIAFRRRGDTTGLADLYQQAPLRVLFPRPARGDLPAAMLTNTAGGLVGGDELTIRVRAGAGSAAMACAQAAEKVYRSTGADSRVEVALTAEAGAWLEWLPQETILFDGARLRRRTVIDLAPEARLLAGGMLAFALSFDEVIVTTFTAGQQQTLPIWMLEELVRPRQRPVTNVVAMVVVLATFLPILGAFYLTRDGDQIAGSGK